MQTTSVLITGISGFIAGNLARTLARRGISVIGSGRRKPTTEILDSGVIFKPCDVTDAAEVMQLIEAIKPQTVYHLAAHSVLTGSSAAHILHTNVTGTVNVLEACRTVGIPACVVVSSDKQYGALATPPFDDNDTTAFLNGGVYELSKSQQDQVARLFAGLYETPAVRVARLVNIYGPGDVQWTRIIPGTIRRCLNGEPARITAGKAGESLREYLYVAHVVEALSLLAEDAHTVGNEPYHSAHGKLASVGFNIGGGIRLSAAGVIDTVRKILQADFGINSPDPILSPGAIGVFEQGSQFNRIDKYRALQEKLRRRYSPTVVHVDDTYAPLEFADSLRKTIPWYIQHLR